ncbi:N-acetylglucosamine-6-sulfatase-like [Plakobranchus ocellatus]|uniref:N-acetylglucosamine-6-sulfatase-like n=1 Tax=Plakobranchus ocellatus TaxID=259542 RepID=A0AAV4A0F4_9GAST|nr:N-acetylglucosamine-6-sulfatase-like [Plakobranchus ocellatus]
MITDLSAWKLLSVVCCVVVLLEKNLLLAVKTTKPNIVFILTDDQDVALFGQHPMPKTKKLITDQGMLFTNMFVTSPLCCPSRSSILSGQFVHNHHTRNNSVSGGCSNSAWQKKTEPKTFITYLKADGYQTFFAGKYLNQYGFKKTGGVEHIPVGWDDWHALVGNSVYYNYSLSVNGKEEKHGDNYTEDYLPDVIHRKGLEFLSKQSERYPFFMMLSTPSCHAPFTPAPQYEEKFKNEKVPRTKNFNVHGKDKHWLIEQAITPMPDDVIEKVDENYRQRHRTLLSVDDMVEGVVNKLKDMGVLDNTYIFFSSDNGFHLGQFSLPIDKRQLYDFDIRVPLIVRGPGVKPNVTSAEAVMSIDLAPTFLDITGTNIPAQFDGMNLSPLLHPKQMNSALHNQEEAMSSSSSMNLSPPSQSARFNSGSPNLFRTSVLYEYFGEAEDTTPGCPQLNNQRVFESVTNIDLAPTFVDLSGSTIKTDHFDGMSFAPLLHGQTHPFRSTVMIEYYGEAKEDLPGCPKLKAQKVDHCDKEFHCVCEDAWNNTYGCIRYETSKESYKFCEFQDTANFIEVYDMNNDPYELTNIIKTASPDLLSKLTKKLAQLSLCAGKTFFYNRKMVEEAKYANF